MTFTFHRGDDERMIAAWLPGVASVGVRETPCTFTLPDVRARRAWGIDVLNGVEQELVVRRRRGTAVVAGVLVKDAPVFVRYTV